LAPAVSVIKDPAKVRAGTIGAARRWADHDRRVVRLDALRPEARRLIISLIEAARAAEAVAEPPAGQS
jgi:hypothetical protein